MDNNIKLFSSAPYLEEMMLMDNEASNVGINIIKYLKDKKYNICNILDIPCGLGRLSIEMAKFGYNVTGIDISEQFLNIANSKLSSNNINKKLNFLKADMYDDDLKKIMGNSPDLILNWWTSIGYRDQADDINFFRKLHDLSHNGSIFILETWHRNFILSHPINKTWKQLKSGYVLIEYNISNFNSVIQSKRRYYKFNNNVLEYEGEFNTRVMLYDLSEIARMLIDTGWEIIDVMNSIEYAKPFNPNNNGLVIVSKSI
jgi:SAM-dependent methyltransferase